MLTKVKSPFFFNTLESITNMGREVILSLIRPKYLSNDPSGYKPLPFSEIMAHTTVVLNSTSKPWQLLATYGNEERQTTIYTFGDFNPQKPTLIFHHGASQTNPTTNLESVFTKEVYQAYNVYAIHAQNHTTHSDYIHNSVDSFLHIQETFAGSTYTVEELVKQHKSHSSKPVIVVGTSMGGIVASLHAFYFGTADLYFPLVAYPNVGEIFLSNAYKAVIQDWDVKSQDPAYLNSFHIQDFDQKLIKKTFPILGSQDQIVKYDKASKFWKEKGFEITTFPYGHTTPAIMSKEIRQLISDKLNQLK